jgi:predicted DNA-binding protein (MmcQ/YjbR family)
MAHPKTEQSAAEMLRSICLNLPEAVEKTTWDVPTYRVRDKIFAMQAGGDEAVNVWCKAKPGMQKLLVTGDPGRFFAPPYVAHKGWIGIRLGNDPDWDEVADLIEESYCLIAPKRLVIELEQRDCAALAQREEGGPP